MKAMTKERLIAIYRHAVPADQYRQPNDAELEAAIAGLKKLIGKEASKVSWARRVVVRNDGTPLLTVVGHQGMWPFPPHGFRVVLPMDLAVELLASSLNPELEREALEAREEKQRTEAKARADAEMAKKRAARQAQQKLEQERAEFHSADWALLLGWQRFAVRFAMAIEKREPELAADIREAVRASLRVDEPDDFPRSTWWKGLGIEAFTRTQREVATSLAARERDEAIVASVVPERRQGLYLMRGSDIGEQAAYVRQVRAANGANYWSHDDAQTDGGRS